MDRITVFRDSELIQETSLENSSYSLGRGPETDIRLEDKTVSRAHARIYREGNAWILEDLNSTNGTLVGGEKIARHEIRGETEIRIGPFRLKFEPSSPPPGSTEIAPLPEQINSTEGRIKSPEPPGESLSGQPGLILVDPEGARRFLPLPSSPETTASFPEIPAEIHREKQSLSLSLRGEKKKIPFSPSWQTLRSGTAVRLVQPDDIITLPPPPGKKGITSFLPLSRLFARIHPSAFLIPVLAGVLLYLIFSPAPAPKTVPPSPPPVEEQLISPELSPPETALRPELDQVETIPEPAPALPGAAELEADEPKSPPRPPPAPAPDSLSPPSLSPSRSQPYPKIEIVGPSEPLDAGPPEIPSASPESLLDAGLNLYLQGELGSARERWSSLAQELSPSDPVRARALSLARLAGNLRNEILLGLKAEEQGDLEEARARWEAARKLDLQISPGVSGRSRQDIHEHLARVISRAGEEALSRQDLPAAFNLWQEALRLLPDYPPAREGLSRLENRALRIYREAYLLESANRKEAGSQYRLILRILPPGHEYYQKSQRRLEHLQ